MLFRNEHHYFPLMLVCFVTCTCNVIDRGRSCEPRSCIAWEVVLHGGENHKMQKSLTKSALRKGSSHTVLYKDPRFDHGQYLLIIAFKAWNLTTCAKCRGNWSSRIDEVGTADEVTGRMFPAIWGIGWRMARNGSIFFSAQDPSGLASVVHSQKRGY